MFANIVINDQLLNLSFERIMYALKTCSTKPCLNSTADFVILSVVVSLKIILMKKVGRRG